MTHGSTTYQHYITQKTHQHLQSLYTNTHLKTEPLEGKILAYHQSTAYTILERYHTYPNDPYVEIKLTDTQYDIIDTLLLRYMIHQYLARKGAPNLTLDEIVVTQYKISHWALVISIYTPLHTLLNNIRQDHKLFNRRWNLKPLLHVFSKREHPPPPPY